MFAPKALRSVQVLIAILLVAVAAADLLVPIGISVWIFYLAPLVLSLLSTRPMVPVAVAGAASLFTCAGYFVSPAPALDMFRDLSRINRAFGVATLLTVGIIGRQFVANKIRLLKQDWIKAGQTGLSLRMEGEQSLAELGRNVLSFIAEYLDALVGSVYVRESAGTLQWQGAFAGRGHVDHVARTEIALGEGLVGQAAAEGRVVVIADVPPGYVDIRSGLGSAAPRTLLLVPTRADGEVNGVLELGFFVPPGQAARELLSVVADSIGVAFRSARFRARQAELLEHTQHQAEELQLQQEELRVANDELEEQGRGLKASAAKLEQQHAELEQTNAQLDAQTRELESQKQDLLSTQLLLKQKLVELERTSRYKSEFMANMSHELRTPLNSSLILAKLLADNRDANLTAEQVKYAESIYAAGNDLLTLIDDVLDLAKIEAAKVDIDVRSVSIAQLFGNLKRRFEPLAKERELELSLALEASCPETIETDQQRLQQVLTNLLSNAIKFTERGSVRLRAAAQRPNFVAFTVEDTGIGIPAEQQGFIFEAFRQADGTTNRKYGGTGLGLSISRELAALLRGEIRLTSTPGQGSVFTLLLPRGPSEDARPIRPLVSVPPTTPEARPASARSQSTPLRTDIEDDRTVLGRGSPLLLVIEDDPIFAGALLDLAHELSLQCLVATSADEGIRLARQHAPMAIILDIGLPDQSGLTVIELLKRDPSTRHVPIQVVSAHDYQKVARSMGAVGYILKPVKRAQLVRAVQLLQERLLRTVKSVLVIEDDRVQREAIINLIAADGIRIVSAESGAIALASLAQITFECIVLDLTLADMSGFELLEKMAADSDTVVPPVIVYTARKLTAHEEHLLRRAARSIIVKGARSPERLLEEVTLFLHQAESELSPEKQRILREACSRESVFETTRILLVEDDVRSVFALTSLLESKGAGVEIARNGREALERLNRKPAIDLVLMDVMMPEMDGLSAMREVRKNSSWSSLPIIALTAKAMPDDRQLCLSAGANDYLAKPVDPEKLMSTLRVWIPG